MIVVRAIKSGKPFQSSIFREEIMTAANSIKREMLADFKKTTRTWTHDVTFGYKVDSGASVGGVRIQVATDDPIYGYVDEGTRPHIIRPRRKKALAFSSVFKPKTKVRKLQSWPGKRGQRDTVRPEVHHPGTKAREFTDEVAKKWKPELARQVQNALTRAARRTGHAKN